ncbi:beta-carotene 15,15'-monooxygenase [Halobacteriales archaeon SW_7_68_16]|nr:MAG: beta-carotene 15,15'-monooxygenase [Halobacteriales archaeon SW_7_68_16]
MATDDDPVATPGFETLRDEVIDADLPVTGSMPDWLAGTYLRSGPGEFEVGGRSLCHWFDALAMVRRFEIDGTDDTVTYANRFVHSEDHRYARREGGVRVSFPGTPADRPPLVRLYHALTGVLPDNPAIGVARIGGRLAAVTETDVATVIDPAPLATRGRLPKTRGMASDATLGHLHYDHERGTAVNLGVGYGRQPRLQLFERPDNRLIPQVVADLTFDSLPYVHSFAITEQYAVIPEIPYGLDARTLLVGSLRGRTFLDAFEARDRPARFHVVDRHSGERVARVRADPLFVYHHANAYEDGDAIVVDLIAYDGMEAITGLTMDRLRSPEPDLPAGDLVRYRLPLSGGHAERRVLLSGPVEFPAIHYRRYNGREHRYVYLAEIEHGSLPTRLAKHDVDRDATTRWEPDGDCRVGEPTFVPAPDPDAEDDGVVLTVVLDADAGRSVLYCLDASDCSELARAPLPHALPYGFHGQCYSRTDPDRSMN